MTKSLKQRVRRLEERLGKNTGVVIIITEAGETAEQAKERYLTEHPEPQGSPVYMTLVTSNAQSPSPPLVRPSPSPPPVLPSGTGKQEVIKKIQVPLQITR